MNFLKKLFNSSPAKPDKKYYIFSVKCKRCGEIIEGRINLEHDLSAEYTESGDTYHARKTLMGENKCFQRIEVQLTFTANRELIEKQITGGEFI